MSQTIGGPSPVTPCCGPPDPCQDLLQQILAFIQNLQKRYWDLRNDVGGLPMTKPAQPHPKYGFRSITGERQQFEDRQKGLRNRLNDYNQEGCGDPPPDAWKWATMETPTADPKPETGLDAKTVAVGGLAGLGVGYLVYRGIRMIPSLFPPLWWSIPANAAAP